MSEKGPDIKIFVSHRIDQDSEVIDNPLYIPVRCGAIYDKRKNIEMLGDNTGDNISDKRNEFCEATVLYWAWKNVKADYYGLCHYRRYLSFQEGPYKVSSYGCVVEKSLSQTVIDKYALNNPQLMKEVIKKYDVITCAPVDVRKIGFGIKNLFDHCKLVKNDFNVKDIDILLQTIKEKSPQYYSYAVNYYKKPMTRWYNCFVMRKNILDNLCSWAFDILFEVENKIDMTYYSQQKQRTLGFFFEHLYGIYIDYLKDKTNVSIKELPLVFIEDIKREEDIIPPVPSNNIPIVVLSSDYYVPYLDVYLRALVDVKSDAYHYDVIVLTKSITDENRKKLQAHFSNEKNLSIRFYNPKKLTGDTQFYVSDACYAEEANYRLLVPWIMKGYSKAIVTDVDLLFRKDPAELYREVVFGEKECIAFSKDVVYQGWILMDPDMMDYAKKTLKLEQPFAYVNTGVMVADLNKIRKIFTSHQILKFANTHRFKIQEQDILNVLYEGKIRFLDISWNYYLRTNSFVRDAVKWAPATAVKDYEASGKSPGVIHWASQPKPWAEPSLLYADIWWDYARKSEFYETILHRMSYTPINNVSFARRVADKYFPKGSKRREMLKFFIPRDSIQWRILKKIYHTIALD